MSILQRILKSLELQGKSLGHGLDSASGAAMARMPRVSNGLDRLATAAHNNPKTAAAMAHLGGGLTGMGVAEGARGLDSFTASDEMSPQMKAALRGSGQKPSEFESTGRAPFRGAVGGASLGSIFGLMTGKKGEALKRALLIGGGVGGLLGAGTEVYRKRGE